MVTLRRLRKSFNKCSLKILSIISLVSSQIRLYIPRWSKHIAGLTIFKKLWRYIISWSLQRKRDSLYVSQILLRSTQSSTVVSVVEKCIRQPKSLSIWRSKVWLILLTRNLESTEMWSLISSHFPLWLRVTVVQGILRELLFFMSRCLRKESKPMRFSTTHFSMGVWKLIKLKWLSNAIKTWRN